MNHYLQSNFHRYGCIGAIIGCICVLFGWNIHWFPMLALTYILGGLAFFLLFSLFPHYDEGKTVTEQPISTPPKTQTPPKPPIELTKPVTAPPTPKINDHAPIHEKILREFQQIELQANPLLNAKSRSLMIDITDIIQFMSQKINESDNQMFKFEISDIQRTLNAYLDPALQHFSSLPSFLRDRKMTTIDKTPHELIEQQLELILEELKKIAESIYLNDLNRLVDHGQFLKQKLQQNSVFNLQLDQH